MDLVQEVRISGDVAPAAKPPPKHRRDPEPILDAEPAAVAAAVPPKENKQPRPAPSPSLFKRLSLSLSRKQTPFDEARAQSRTLVRAVFFFKFLLGIYVF